jgi:Fe-S-cluster containining protein
MPLKKNPTPKKHPDASGLAPRKPQPAEEGRSTRNPFPCTQCGLCCQNVHRADETRFLDRGDGTCQHYDAASKLCAIYHERPDICRVDRQYDMHYATQTSWDDFVTLNLKICAILQGKGL